MKSIWSHEVEFCERGTLNGDITADVVVIGAGIAGLLTAYLLMKKGLNVVVLEKENICSGETSGTTAKITHQQGQIYSKIEPKLGELHAKNYAEAGRLAIEKFFEIENELNSGCDLIRIPSYLYSKSGTEEVEKEFEASKKAGINAELCYNLSDLPFETEIALKFPDTAQYQPLKFLKAVSDKLNIYTKTEVISVEENGVTTSGGRVLAKQIVVATHYPFINAPGYYFTRLHQERSYALALENVPLLSGMYNDISPSGHAFRPYKNMIILSGEDHRTGDKNESKDGYERIEEFAKQCYPECKVAFRWSAQDCITPDGIPYIGRYSADIPNLYVATGFNKWGMTNSMVAAIILSNQICDINIPFAETFSPRRLGLTAAASIAKDSLTAAGHLLKRGIYNPFKYEKDIAPGTGKIITVDGEKLGIYKDDNGKCFYVEPKCTHLGCQLEWNQSDLSWDCPCHGSRFDITGNVLSNPATVPLKSAYDLENQQT